MPGSVLGPCLVLVVAGVVLPSDAFRVVLVAGVVLAGGVFAARAVAQVRRRLRRSFPGQTTGEAPPGPGFTVVWPLGSVGVDGDPTPFASADSAQGRDAA